MKIEYQADGSAIRYLGSLENTTILIMLCRDNLNRDTSFFDAITQAIPSHQCTLIWHEHSPKPPSPSATVYQDHISDIEFRCQSLKKFIQSLGPNKHISILSQSGGGRIASLIADELPIQKIICLGYPFRAINQPLEPERYTHLKTLRTPFLIIQGRYDPYGTPESIARDHPLSGNIELEFIETGHDFELSKIEEEQLMSRILEALIPKGVRAPTEKGARAD